MVSVERPPGAVRAAARSRFAVPFFVWTTWLLMSGIALTFVRRLAPRAPFGDDWTLLMPPLIGLHPVTPGLLWAQSNEHRVPLIKAILLPLVWATNGRFVVENYLNVLVLAGVAAVLILTARRLRGAYRVTDAFFPLALLHMGHYELLFIRMTLSHVLSTALVGLVLAFLASHRGELSLRRAWLLGGLMLCLPLTGANGLPVVLAGVAWLVYVAWDGRRGGPAGAGRVRLSLLGPAAAATLLVGLYFVNFRLNPSHPPPPSLRALLRTGAQALGGSLTPFRPELWPWVGLVVPALACATGALLVRRWWTDGAERVRAVGLLLFLGATLGVALGVAWGRAGLSPWAGTAPRYAIITIPVLFAVYLAWLVYSPRRGRGVMEAVLLALLCVSLPQFVLNGYRYGTWLRPESTAFVRAVREGAPTPFLTARFSGSLFSDRFAPRLSPWMAWARRAGLRPYRDAAADPDREFREEALAAELVGIHQMTWDGSAGRASGPDPYLVFALPAPRHVTAVRVRFVLDGPSPTPGWFDVFWRQDGVNDFQADQRNHRFMLNPGPQEQTLVVWVNDTIDRIRLDPDTRPRTFELREMTLLTEKERSAGTSGT